jgi:dynein heavy chain 1
MVLVKVLRPDRFGVSAGNFVKYTLGDEALNTAQADLQELVEGRCDPKSPLCLVSAPGFDASFRVEELAKKTGKKLKSCAIGSPEAFE